jgi:hypothetical protein
LTIHLRDISASHHNLRSLKHLTTRNNKRNFGTSHAHIESKKDSRTVPVLNLKLLTGWLFCLPHLSSCYALQLA